MNQARDFIWGEGDAWFKRNQERLGKIEDPVMEVISQCEFIKPKNVLEIGCSNGFRLANLHNKYGCECNGIEPSYQAVLEANKHKNVSVIRGTANNLGFRNGIFDLVIFGFCLYLVDRADLLKVVSEADRVLDDKGYLVIYDFFPPSTPYRVEYKHKKGLWSYHMDYSKLFLANPAYRSVISYAPNTAPDEPDVLVAVLQKRMALAYADGEL